tara:strand:- start:3442 stop:3936 length:495 start_codon:yes stop_codon:yes gene_type:complete
MSFQPSQYSGWLPGWVPGVATWEEKKEGNVLGPDSCKGCITGDENDEAKALVQTLQYQLSRAGYLSSGHVSGLYDSNTVSAVEKLQRATGLAVDGMAGEDTMAALLTRDRHGEATPAPTTAVAPTADPAIDDLPLDIQGKRRAWFWPVLLVGAVGAGVLVWRNR